MFGVGVWGPQTEQTTQHMILVMIIYIIMIIVTLLININTTIKGLPPQTEQTIKHVTMIITMNNDHNNNHNKRAPSPDWIAAPKQ